MYSLITDYIFIEEAWKRGYAGNEGLIQIHDYVIHCVILFAVVIHIVIHCYTKCYTEVIHSVILCCYTQLCIEYPYAKLYTCG